MTQLPAKLARRVQQDPEVRNRKVNVIHGASATSETDSWKQRWQAESTSTMTLRTSLAQQAGPCMSTYSSNNLILFHMLNFVTVLLAS